MTSRRIPSAALLAAVVVAGCGGRDALSLRGGAIPATSDGGKLDARDAAAGDGARGPDGLAMLDVPAAPDAGFPVDFPAAERPILPPLDAPRPLDGGFPFPDAGPFMMLTGLDVTPALSTLGVGTTATFVATARFSNGTTPDVTAMALWTSSNPAVATVMGGRATAVAPGTASITATYMGRTAMAMLTVTGSMIRSISVDPVSATVPITAQFPLRATALYADGTKVDVTTQATWMSTDPTVASVVAGSVTGVRAGAVTVSASLQGVTGSSQVTVTTATLTSIDVEPATLTLPVNGSRTFTATAIYSDGSKGDITTVAMWGSSNPGVLNVSSAAGTQGQAMALGAGTAIVTARFLGATGQATVTVSNTMLAAITITPANGNLPTGTTQPFKATGMYVDGTMADITTSVAWSTSNAAVASISNAMGTEGVATGLTAGTVQVSATLSGVTGMATLNVTQVTVTALTITPKTVTVGITATQQFLASAMFSDNTSKDVTAMTAWSIGDPTIAGVSNAAGTAGQITGLKAGMTQVTATYMGKTDTANVTVTTAVLTSITVSPATNSLITGLKANLTATGMYSDGTTLDVTQQATWTSDNTMVAIVSNTTGVNGQVTAVAAGSATIHAQLNGKDGTASVTVTSPMLTQVSVSPNLPSRRVGQNLAFSASAIYSNGTSQNVTMMATWSSSNPAVATVDTGRSMCVSAGTAVISASYMGLMDQTTLTCTPMATVVRISVQPISARLRVGQSMPFSATAILSDNTTMNVTGQATWMSANTAIADVTNGGGGGGGGFGGRGLVTGIGPGMTTITATYMGLSDMGQVTVDAATLVRISVQPALASVRVGQTQQLSATAIYSDNSTQNVTGMATWVSSDPSTADVSNGGGGGGGGGGFGGGGRGTVTGIKPGSATITATYMGLSDSATVTVSGAKLTGISVSPVVVSLRVGQNQPLQATALYDDGTSQNVTFTADWISSAPAVADVSNGGGFGGPGGGGGRGVVTALSAGTATITATYMGFSDKSTVTVTAPKLTSINISPVNPTITVGQMQPMMLTAIFDDGTSQNVTGMATWVSSDSTVADVSDGGGGGFGGPGGGGRGTVTGIKAGTATITATYMSMSASTTVTVTGATVTSIQVTPVNPSITKGGTVQMQAVAIYSDNTSRNVTGMATWTSSNSGVADVSDGFGSKGQVTGISAGTADITATFSGASGKTTVTVTAATITEIQVSPTNPSIAVNQTQQFQAVAIYSDFTSQNITQMATWTSSNTAVAQISTGFGRGLATGLMAGTTTITASFNGSMGSTTLTVTGATLKQIDITPTNPTAPAGVTLQFTATAVMTDNTTQNVTGTATWTSSDETVATVSNTGGSRGLATAIKPGTVTIKATVNGITGQTMFTVGTQTLTSITVTPAMPMIAKGATQQFTATGTYSDNSTFDLTKYVTWISSTSSVATVSNASGSQGLATGVATGTTNIQAYFQMKMGSAPLTVQ